MPSDPLGAPPLTPSAFAEARAELTARPDLSGPGRRHALSDLADRWLTRLLAAALAGDDVTEATTADATTDATQGTADGPVADLSGDAARGVALVAVGGYGRRELSPGSDLDVLLLHDGRRSVNDLAERIWYPVWDSGVHLDHSVRTVDQARQVAAGDLPVQLGLLNARHIAGDAELSQRLQGALLGDWRAKARSRLAQLRELWDERGQRFGNLAYLLEGDLKEARGGIRDIYTLYAIAASWVADVPHARLTDAHGVLLDIRDALHTTTGRRVDRLLLQEQDAVADTLGMRDADALLRRVSEAARSVGYCGEITWRRVNQVIEPARRTVLFRRGSRRRAEVERTPLASGVVEQGGEAVLARDAHPAADPVLVLRAAAAAAQAGIPLSPHTLTRLAEESAPMPVPWPEEGLREFVRLLGSGPALVGVWEGLDWHGIPGRLLPEWERVRHLPQRNALHQFTVDRHLIEAAVQASSRTRQVRRPDLLLLGALLHDIGKGLPGDHSDVGVAIADGFARRWGMSEADRRVLGVLVRHHLLLPGIATARDLDDPATIATVADTVGSVEVLDLLHALTEADALATGPAAWNSWRASLVAALVERTRALLSSGTTPEPTGLTDTQRKLAEAGQVSVTLDTEAAPGEAAELTVVAPDRIGLLALVAAVLGLHRLQVRSAVVESVDTMAVQVWTVAPTFGELPEEAALRQDVERAIAGTYDPVARLTRREADQRPRPGMPPAPPRVTLAPEASAQATVMEVRAHDTPGLLHRIGSALATAEVDVRQARVSTLGAEAIDAFYLVDPVGAPLPLDRATQVAAAVEAALRRTEPDSGGPAG